jgi:hypothetical protein
MFEANSGRNFERCIWKVFTYDVASDKSKCIIFTNGGDCERACGQGLVGKNATNLKYLMKSHMKSHDKFSSHRSHDKPSQVQQ